MNTQIILASSSPRRAELLQQLGINYQVYTVDIDESPLMDELALDYVQRIALAKATTAKAQANSHLPILAADTAVVLNNSIMGKPRDYQQAYNMLAQLSGQTHSVYTAICVHGLQIRCAVSRSEVQFKALTEQEIKRYCATNEPWDKAGSYAIQGLAAMFISELRGSFSGVMGLPLFETAQLLQAEGLVLL